MRFLGVKIAPENWVTKYPLNCFTYNSGIFHNGTNRKNILIIRDDKCDFPKFDTKFSWGWTTTKILFIT